MTHATTRLLLAAAALAATVPLAQAQTGDLHHPGSQDTSQPMQVPMTTPPAGMTMTGPNSPAGQPQAMGGPMDGAMGGDTGRMMEMMRPMMAGRGGMGMPFEHIEGRIAYLRAELGIADAQAASWNAFADTMRADAAAMKAMHDGMMEGAKPATLPDRLAAQQRMLSARVAMLGRMEAGMKPLYAVLSADQRKAMDQATAGPMGMM